MELSVPRPQGSYTTEERQLINWRMVAAVVMLIVWAIGTVLEWAGWVHGLLTAGVFLLILAVVRGPGGADRA